MLLFVKDSSNFDADAKIFYLVSLLLTSWSPVSLAVVNFLLPLPINDCFWKILPDELLLSLALCLTGLPIFVMFRNLLYEPKTERIFCWAFRKTVESPISKNIHILIWRKAEKQGSFSMFLWHKRFCQNQFSFPELFWRYFRVTLGKWIHVLRRKPVANDLKVTLAVYF